MAMHADGAAMHGSLDAMPPRRGDDMFRPADVDIVVVAVGMAGRAEYRRDVIDFPDALGRPRYIVPREIDRIEDTWLSKLLPRILGRYFKRKRRHLVMYHAVPAALDDNKGLAALYGRHWNRQVSPGDPVYVHRGEGEQVLEDGERLAILVEKDFVCLTDRENEDESDMFPHPEADVVKGRS